MKQVLGPVLFVSAGPSLAGRVGVLGMLECVVVDGSGRVSCHFSPTHSPNPSLAPPGERGGLHLATFFKAGTLRLTARWPQSGANPATSRCSQIRPRISSPSLDFSVRRPESRHADQALPQHQLAPSCVQRIENARTPFDGNAPLRAFFPPLKTRPNVAVRSPFRPGGGGEGLGERGGIQRIRNKTAADNRRGNSSNEFPCSQKMKQKQEHTNHIARGLEAKKTKINSQYPQTTIQELTA